MIFCFNVTAPTEIYTLSLHDALPICLASRTERDGRAAGSLRRTAALPATHARAPRSEEHTSELQSRENLVCRLLLEKKKNEISVLVFVSRPLQVAAGAFANGAAPVPA